MLGGGGSDEAALAREEEQKRQEDIRAGTARINTIFDGGYTQNAVAAGTAYDPNATYYTSSGSVWQPEAYQYNGAERSRETKSAEQQFADALSSGSIYTLGDYQSGFDDSFFEGRKQAYLDYYTPQLEDQYSDAQKELTYALTRGGNLNSSTRGAKLSELQQLYDTNKQSIADQALAHESDTRTAVENARSDLIATLNATGDAQQAANSALSRASVLSQPAAYDALGQLFVDFTNGLGIQAAQERAAAASGGYYQSRYNTGLFGGAGRVKVS